MLMTDPSFIENLLKQFEIDIAKPLDPNHDYTPVIWNGQIVGTRQDLIDGKIDPMDISAWGP